MSETENDPSTKSNSSLQDGAEIKCIVISCRVPILLGCLRLTLSAVLV